MIVMLKMMIMITIMHDHYVLCDHIRGDSALCSCCLACPVDGSHYPALWRVQRVRLMICHHDFSNLIKV